MTLNMIYLQMNVQ